VHNRFISTVERVEFVSCLICIKLRGGWCHVIVLNSHASSQDKMNYVKDNSYEKMESIFNILPKYHLKILLGDFSAKAGGKDFFKPTFRNESLYEIHINNGVTVENFTITEISQAKVQYSHIVTSINILGHLDVSSIRAADCDTSTTCGISEEGSNSE
jgi:hypothetical protein